MSGLAKTLARFKLKVGLTKGTLTNGGNYTPPAPPEGLDFSAAENGALHLFFRVF